MKQNNPIALLLGWLGLVLTPTHAINAADNSSATQGTIIGTVSSAETRNTLQGAVVSAPAAGKAVLTDNAGRFVLTDITAGPVELAVSYTGFDDFRQTVVVSRSEPTRLAVELKSSSVLTLEAYTVSSEREGNALAVTQQRNASNVKNVIAMDSLGNLPNGNAGELIAQLPGISGTFDGEGNVTNVSIRGTPPSLTRVNVDGLPLTIVGDRAPALHSFSGGLYEQVEVIKGQTPDKSADSLGGMVNLKTRSTLSMNEKRRITYNFSVRWAPSFFERTPMRADHPIHPLLNFSYQEVFDVLGGKRNLGVSVNFSYNENVNEVNQIFYDYQNSAQSPNFIWDHRSIAYYNNRHVTSTNVKAEYRSSDASKIYFNAIYNMGNEPAIDNNQVRAFTNQVVATLDANGQPTGTGGILPGYTSTVTQVRPVAASFFEQANFSLPFWSRTPTLTLGAEHKMTRWEIDYSARYSQTHYDQTAGQGGQFVARVPNVGWIIDRTDRNNPKFTQTAGGSIFDIRSYTSDISFTRRDNVLDIELTNLEGNVKYSFDTKHPTALKGGVTYRKDTRERSVNDAHQWTRTPGAPPLSTAWLTFKTPFDERGGQRLPAIESRSINAEVNNPALWTENLYYTPQQKYTSNSKVTEKVQAAYMMAQGKVDRIGYLAGVRFEQTDVSGSGYIRGPLATAAQIPDPVARAIHDYNNPVTNKGSYDRSFPSAHVYSEFTKDFIGRASWSTSFGRPGMATLAPSATVSETAQTVSASNPGIGPQYSKNVDISLEYYFKPAGLISLGYFSKDIADYIVTAQIGTIGDGANNGFGGLYSGYTLSSTINAGKAEVDGWEFNYIQQLTFLPGLLRGLQLSANYTELKAKGNFGGTNNLGTNEIAGFIPKTANVSLTFNYKKFGSRLTLGYVGDYLVTYNANPTARIYREELSTLNLGVSYRVSPKLTVYCDATNVTEEYLSFYRYVPSLFREARRMQSAVIFGVSGRF
ncbi:MAG: TonB-dependent receptor [Verrucomicrobia bacterium]|nr:TonB-dependent receptor [Verrucomicrobiota bacterium]